jgi:hypothetical protein
MKIDTAKGVDRWRALVDTGMKLRVPHKAWDP